MSFDRVLIRRSSGDVSKVEEEMRCDGRL